MTSNTRVLSEWMDLSRNMNKLNPVLRQTLTNLNQSRHLAYYRFHKRVGKGRWGRYVERYQSPRSLENTQRLIYNYSAKFSDQKRSVAWQWNFPKNIAKALHCNAVLEAVIYYRHKRFRPYHYMKILKRLIDLGGCEISDWRFQFVAKNINKIKNQFLNLPRIALYYGKLGATQELQKITRFLSRRIDIYTMGQLCNISYAFNLCKLQDKYLFSLIYKQVIYRISEISNTDLVRLIKGFSGSLICNLVLLRQISLEVQYRVQVGCKSSDESRVQHPTEIPPTINQLICIAEAFSALKFQDFSFFGMMSSEIRKILTSSGYLDNAQISPPQIAELITSFQNLKINDIHLLETILAHLDNFIYDYDPKSIAVIGAFAVRIIPPGIIFIDRVCTKMAGFLLENIQLMDFPTVTNSFIFIRKANLAESIKKELIHALTHTITRLSNGAENLNLFDLPNLMEVLAFAGVTDVNVYDSLSRHFHRFVESFEPHDFARAARAILRCKKISGYVDKNVLNSIARNTLRHQDEFSGIDYFKTLGHLIEAGPPDGRYLRKLLLHLKEKRPLKGFSNFDTLEGVVDDVMFDKKLMRDRRWIFGRRLLGEMARKKNERRVLSTRTHHSSS